MAAPNSPERTTQVSSASVMSFAGPAARACPAEAETDGDEGFVAECEIHTQEALLTPVALRPSAKQAQSARLAQTDGDRHSGVRLGTPSQVGSVCSSRSRKQEKTRQDQVLQKEIQNLWVTKEEFQRLQWRKESPK